MKYLFFIALSFVLVNNSYGAQKSKKEIDKKSSAIEVAEYKTGDIRYGENHGMLEYSQLTNVRSQTRVIIYFDNYGEIELKEIFVQLDQGEKRELRHSYNLIKDGVEFAWDVKNVVNGVDVLKKVITATEIDKKINILKTPFFDRRFFNLYDYKSEGQEQVGKFLCEKYSLALDKKELNDRIIVSQYKNMPLRVEYGKTILSCIRANFSQVFPYQKIVFPSDYKTVKERIKIAPNPKNIENENIKTNSAFDSSTDKSNGKKTLLEKPKFKGR